MDIYFIRHTSVDVPQGICYGQSDVAVNNSFLEETNIVKEKLAGVEFDLCYSSPLSRCRKLAEHCSTIPIQFNDAIKELDFGDWEMHPWEGLDSATWGEDWVNSVVPNGESFLVMYQRVKEFIESLKNHHAKNISVFTHGGVCACAMVYFENINLEQAFERKANYGEVIRYTL